MIIPREFPDGWNTDVMCPVCGHTTLRVKTNRRTRVQFLACPVCEYAQRIPDLWHTEQRQTIGNESGLMESLDDALRAGELVDKVDGVDEYGRTGTRGGIGR